MRFDPVHDTQAVHRALVQAFSFPGTPVPLEAAQRAVGLGIPSVLAAVALTLLDAETTFSFPVPSSLTELTGAGRRPESEAAFVFLPEWDDQAWVRAFSETRRGTLRDPHGGATVVSFCATGVSSSFWVARGPGIEREIVLNLPGGLWIEARNQACTEFPLGVDWVWAREDSLVALPRTTRLGVGA